MEQLTFFNTNFIESQPGNEVLERDTDVKMITMSHIVNKFSNPLWENLKYFVSKLPLGVHIQDLKVHGDKVILEWTKKDAEAKVLFHSSGRIDWSVSSKKTSRVGDGDTNFRLSCIWHVGNFLKEYYTEYNSVKRSQFRNWVIEEKLNNNVG